MERINFTQAAMFQLATINTYLRRTMGSHYKVSDETDLESLLKEAFSSDDSELQRRCSRLVECLWTEDQQKLMLLLRAKAG